MSGSKSKNKGKSGERELAKIFEGIFKGSFIRVPNSGAYIGGKNAFRVEVLSDGQIRNVKGDIIPPDFMPKLVLECKFYADFPFHSLMTEKTIPILEAWIEQTTEVLDKDDIWFLAFKINRRGWFIVMDDHRAENYTIKNHAKYGAYVITEMKEFLKNNKDIILERTA